MFYYIPTNKLYTNDLEKLFNTLPGYKMERIYDINVIINKIREVGNNLCRGFLNTESDVIFNIENEIIVYELFNYTISGIITFNFCHFNLQNGDINPTFDTMLNPCKLNIIINTLCVPIIDNKKYSTGRCFLNLIKDIKKILQIEYIIVESVEESIKFYIKNGFVDLNLKKTFFLLMYTE